MQFGYAPPQPGQGNELAKNSANNNGRQAPVQQQAHAQLAARSRSGLQHPVLGNGAEAPLTSEPVLAEAGLKIVMLEDV